MTRCLDPRHFSALARLFVASLALTFWLGCANCVFAQEDVFGNSESDELVDPTAPVATANANAKAVAPQTDINERSAVVLSFRNNPPKTVAEHAHAIKVLSRIQHWDEVGRWLDSLGKQSINGPAALEITKQIGTTTLASIQRNGVGLTESQLSLIRKILDLSQRAVHDPNLLAANVKRLTSASRGERINAFQALESAGSSGIAALIQGVLQDESLNPNATMREAFSLLGDGAVKAWQTAMTTSQLKARQRLGALVTDTSNRDFVVELAALKLQDPSVDAPALSTRVQPLVQNLLENQLAEYKRNRWRDVPKTYGVWVLGKDQRSLTQINGTVADLYLSRAGQLALSRLRMSEHTQLDSALAAAVWLEYQSAYGDPDSIGLDSLDGILPADVRNNTDYLSLVWDAANKERLIGAQTRLVLAMQRLAGATETLLPNPIRERLVEGLTHGNPEVRYGAAEALLAYVRVQNAAGQEQVSFEGRTRLDRVLDEMKRLDAKPLVLIAGGAENLRTHTAGLLELLGYIEIEASSAKGVFAQLNVNQPVEAIFIVDHTADMDLGQLIQRIRSRPATSSVPIALLASGLTAGEHLVAGDDHRVVMSGVPPLIDQMGDIVRRMKAVTESREIESPLRVAWQTSAQEYWESVRAKSLAAKNLVMTTNIPDTAVGQSQLVSIVSDSSTPVPQREQASKIFVQSVRQFGLMISSEMAKAQYDEYNVRAADDPVTRAVLGRVLDAIEAGNGNREWSSVRP